MLLFSQALEVSDPVEVELYEASLFWMTGGSQRCDNPDASELRQVKSKAVIFSLVSHSNNSAVEARQASCAPSTRLRAPLTFTVGHCKTAGVQIMRWKFGQNLAFHFLKCPGL